MQLVGHIVEVTGLSPDVTEEDLYDFFCCCGKIENLEIFRYEGQRCTAYVTFRGAYAVENAVLLSGATMGNQCVSISRLETSLDDTFREDDYLSKLEDRYSSSGCRMDQSTAGVEQAVTSLMAKGKEALIIAKAIDDTYHVSSTAAKKVVQLTDKMGLTGQIYSTIVAAKTVDKKYHVSDITKSVASVTGRTVVATATAVVNSDYFARGALWVSGVLDSASKAAADLGKRGA